MFTITIKEPYDDELDMETRIYVECVGKYGFKYIVGDILKKMRADLFEELIVVTWHPKRVVDWCFDEEQLEVKRKFDALTLY